MFERWLGEILSDLWSCARLGVSATLGLMGVVSLPSAFVFRLSGDDPHPVPWIRVQLSCAMGQALFPHPQWQRVANLWAECYPPVGLTPAQGALIDELMAAIPGFVSLLVEHRPRALRGRSLREALNVEQRQPARLAALFGAWQRSPAPMYRAAPSLVFATLGQARFNGQLSPEEEGHLFAKLLTSWALRSELGGANPPNTRMFAVQSRHPPGLLAA